MAKTVLIVEDNELNMKLFHDLLEAHGYHRQDAQRDRGGRSRAPAPPRSHPDGHPAAGSLGSRSDQWLKEDDDLRAIPVVAVTAFAMKGDEEQIRQGGCEAYLSKPISVASSSRRVRAIPRILRRKSAA